MKNVILKLHNAIKEIFKLIDNKTILVGHDIQNDLTALNLFHYNIIDTVILYAIWHWIDKKKKDIPTKISLKKLTKEHLNKYIQNNSKTGHSSVIDARCAMQLMLKELEIEYNINKKYGLNVCKKIPYWTYECEY